MLVAVRSINWLGVTVACCSRRATCTAPPPKDGNDEAKAHRPSEDRAPNKASQDGDDEPNATELRLSNELANDERYEAKQRSSKKAAADETEAEPYPPGRVMLRHVV